MQNTGYKSFETLEKYFTDDGTSTGETKPNIVTDRDYIAPVLDLAECPPTQRFYNTVQTKTVRKNNCDHGSAGSAVTVTAFANQFVSNESIVDANNKALAWLEETAQSYANNKGSCIVDYTAPSSVLLSVSAITPNSAALSWTEATDNIEVSGYEIYQNNIFLVSTTSDILHYDVPGLFGSTNYVFYVKAKDAAGNSSNSNSIAFTTLPSSVILKAAKSVIFQKSTTSWSDCKNAASSDSQDTTNKEIGGGTTGSQFYLGRYRGVIDTSSITTKPKTAKIKFRFSENTVGNTLTFNLYGANVQIPVNQNFQLTDWDDWDPATFISSVSVPSNSTGQNEIALTSAQLDLLRTQEAFNFFLISNGDKENISPGTNKRPTLSIANATGEVFLECEF